MGNPNEPNIEWQPITPLELQRDFLSRLIDGMNRVPGYNAPILKPSYEALYAKISALRNSEEILTDEQKEGIRRIVNEFCVGKDITAQLASPYTPNNPEILRNSTE